MTDLILEDRLLNRINSIVEMFNGGEGLVDDLAAFPGVLLEVLREALGQGDRNVSLHLRVAELAFGLAFKHGVGQLHGNHRAQAFARVFAGDVSTHLRRGRCDRNPAPLLAAPDWTGKRR